MNPQDLRATIQAATDRFALEIAAAFAEVFAGVASSISAKPITARAVKAVAKPVAKAPAVKIAAKAAKPGKRVRRSESQLAADGERIIKLLAANEQGLRIEQINQHLGAAAKQLARPISKLLAERKIRKTGEKRATVYLPATAPAKRAAPAVAKKPAPKKPAPAAPKPVRAAAGSSSVTSEQLFALLSSSKGGLRAEQINKALGTTSDAIKEPIAKLLAQGEIKRTGKARGTVYSKA